MKLKILAIKCPSTTILKYVIWTLNSAGIKLISITLLN